MDDRVGRADIWLATESGDPQLAVIGLPWSPSSDGIARSPLALRDRLSGFVTFDSERQTDFSEVQVRDFGNWPVAGLGAEALRKYIAARREELPSTGLSLFLGGDDAITAAIVAAMGASLIRFSSKPSGLDGVETVTIGAHGFNRADSAGTTLGNDQIAKEGTRMIVDRALGKLAMSETIHVSVDLDALDPAFAPGSPDSMPGGLDIRQLADAVRRCATSPKVGSMDFVGADANLDESGRTLDVTCHLFLTAVTGFRERSPTA